MNRFLLLTLNIRIPQWKLRGAHTLLLSPHHGAVSIDSTRARRGRGPTLTIARVIRIAVTTGRARTGRTPWGIGT